MTAFEAIMQVVRIFKPEKGWRVVKATRRKLIMRHVQHGERVVSFGNGPLKIRGGVP